MSTLSVDVNKPITPSGFTTYRLRRGSDVLGSVRTRNNDSAKARLVSDLFISPELRGNGLSRRLMEFVLSNEPKPVAISIGAYGDGKKLSNDQLREYYKRLGFDKVIGGYMYKMSSVTSDKQAVVGRKGKKWVLYNKDKTRILGTHDTAQEAYKQEYAIEKSVEREREKSSAYCLGYDLSKQLKHQ